MSEPRTEAGKALAADPTWHSEACSFFNLQTDGTICDCDAPAEIARVEKNARAQANTELLALLETGWGIIANASQGNWEREHPDWQDAATRWRDRYFATLQAVKTGDAAYFATLEEAPLRKRIAELEAALDKATTDPGCHGPVEVRAVDKSRLYLRRRARRV